jgi:hypothetical protein
LPWLEDQPPSDGADVEGLAEDRSAITALRASGVDTGRPRDIAHDLWFPDASSARRATELVRKPGRTVVVGPTGAESGCPVIVFVQQELSPGAIGALRAEFEAVVTDMGGSYQGWSLAGGPKPDTEGDR